MNKVLLLCSLLPILSGVSAARGGLQTLVKKDFVYTDSTHSVFSKDVTKLANHSFQSNHCNPDAQYKIQTETTYPMTDLNGDTVIVYKAEFRVFGETDQGTFNGYQAGKKFRVRGFTLQQSSHGLSISDMSCEVSKT